jgi:hypothetical protein
LGWPIKTIDIIVIFPQLCLYWLMYRGVVILENPLIIFEFYNDWPKIIINDVYVLGRVNISFYICDCTNSVFTYTPLPPKTLQTHGRRHYDFHTILNIACSTFPRISATHTHVNVSLTPPAFQQKILFFSIVLVLSSVVYFGTIAHDFFLFFNEIVSVFATILLWKPFLVSRLWIDLLQIGTGTDWINSFIKSRNLPPILRSCLTSLINTRSPCLLVDLGRPVRGLCSIVSLWSNIFFNLDTADRLNPIIFPISVFLNPSWCSRTTYRFWSGLTSFVFLAMLRH